MTRKTLTFKKSLLTFACMALTAGGAYTAFSPRLAHAEETAATKPVKLGFADVKAILTQAKAAQNINDQRKALYEKFYADVKKNDEALKTEGAAIQDQNGKISKEDYLEKAHDFEKKRIKIQEDLQDREQKLEKAYAEAMQKLGQALSDVVEGIAKEKGFSAVISHQYAVYVDDSLDITQDVIKKLDQKITEVKLTP